MSSSEEVDSPSSPVANDFSSTLRNFNIGKVIEEHFDDKSTNLSHEWSFVFDDGIFERQANFSTTNDMWRHLDRVDCAMTKSLRKAKKGSVRMFRTADINVETSTAGKWIIRFSRKFPGDLSELWVLLAVRAISGQMPHSDLLLGCVFTTRKGKCEMEIHLQDDPSTDEICNDCQIRYALKIPQTEDTIQFKFYSALALSIKKQEALTSERNSERVHQIQQKKKKASTWPRAPIELNIPESPPSVSDLEKMKQQLFEVPDPFMQYSPYCYSFEASAELPEPCTLRLPCVQPTPLPLQILQVQQLELLRLAGSDSEGNTRKDSLEEAIEKQKETTSALSSVHYRGYQFQTHVYKDSKSLQTVPSKTLPEFTFKINL